LRTAWGAEIATRQAESQEIRHQLGRSVLAYLHDLFPAHDNAMWEYLQEQFARTDPTMVHTFDMFMRFSELAHKFTPQQLEAMAERLSRIDIFRNISLADLENLSRAVEVAQFDDGEMIFDKGDDGDALYLIEAGAIAIYAVDHGRRENHLRTFGVGQVIGDFAVLDGEQRSARARAEGALSVLVLRREVFQMFIQSRPQVIRPNLHDAAGVDGTSRQCAITVGTGVGAGCPRPANPRTRASRMMVDVDDLRRFPLLRTISASDLAALGTVMRRRMLPRNTILFRKGDPGDTMLLICSGQVRIFMRDDQGNEITFRTLGAGHSVGEFSLLDRKPRSASAVALTPLDVLILQREDFLRLLRERPMVGMELIRSIAERIRYTTSYLERLYEALELLANSEYDEAIREMALSSDEDEIQTLITTFVEMVRRVQERANSKNKPL
jgi:CRP-like cAMP-binding protein